MKSFLTFEIWRQILISHRVSSGKSSLPQYLFKFLTIYVPMLSSWFWIPASLTPVLNLPRLLYSPKPSLYPFKLSQTQYLCLLLFRRSLLSTGAHILTQGIVLLMTWLNAGVAIWHPCSLNFWLISFLTGAILLLDYEFSISSLSLPLSHIKCLFFLLIFQNIFFIFFFLQFVCMGPHLFHPSTYQGIYLIKYYFLF